MSSCINLVLCGEVHFPHEAFYFQSSDLSACIFRDRCRKSCYHSVWYVPVFSFKIHKCIFSLQHLTTGYGKSLNNLQMSSIKYTAPVIDIVQAFLFCFVSGFFFPKVLSAITIKAHSHGQFSAHYNIKFTVPVSFSPHTLHWPLKINQSSYMMEQRKLFLHMENGNELHSTTLLS